MQMPIQSVEVKAAIFSLKKGKAPGNGFTPEFFISAWPIVGLMVVEAVQEFFRNGRMLRQAKFAVISLAPKKATVNKIKDYRPISCCNTIYKSISKILADTIRNCIGNLVGPAQSTFIPGRRIADNVLLAQELLLGYGSMRGPKGCVIQFDIEKAFDSVDWGFL
ncbi:hypothetical protein MLD38_034563 [Melastoma candidum]|uniref:Uncharacterized protein n=1 Tax=Melastoma candidum TaxID=119954 RepID=A0ACB9MAA8_9MYRT|nr:hypothetical protein MLD38_034563 [Melastoma candidum]